MPQIPLKIIIKNYQEINIPIKICLLYRKRVTEQMHIRIDRTLLFSQRTQIELVQPEYSDHKHT